MSVEVSDGAIRSYGRLQLHGPVARRIRPVRKCDKTNACWLDLPNDDVPNNSLLAFESAFSALAQRQLHAEWKGVGSDFASVKSLWVCGGVEARQRRLASMAVQNLINDFRMVVEDMSGIVRRQL